MPSTTHSNREKAEYSTLFCIKYIYIYIHNGLYIVYKTDINIYIYGQSVNCILNPQLSNVGILLLVDISNVFEVKLFGVFGVSGSGELETMSNVDLDLDATSTVIESTA